MVCFLMTRLKSVLHFGKHAVHKVSLALMALNQMITFTATFLLFEPSLEKTANVGFRPGPTQTDLYSHRRELES